MACDLMERHNRRANFDDVVSFIERQVRIISDPVFGCIQSVDKGVFNKQKDVNKWKPQSLSKPKFKGNSFATSITDVDRSTVKEVKANFSNPVTCLFCLQNHSLEQCKQFEKTRKGKLSKGESYLLWLPTHWASKPGVCKALNLQDMLPKASQCNAHTLQRESG